VPARRSTAIQAALLRKGFRVDERDHHYLVLYVEGRRTSIRTKLGHGSTDYGDSLLSRMKQQVRLPTVRQLLSLTDCPMGSEDYLALLREGQQLPPR
jgi:hypothetical protein